MGKKELNDTEICMRYITPGIEQAGWDVHRQVRREVKWLMVHHCEGVVHQGRRTAPLLNHRGTSS